MANRNGELKKRFVADASSCPAISAAVVLSTSSSKALARFPRSIRRP